MMLFVVLLAGSLLVLLPVIIDASIDALLNGL
jgi:hypothetical protein